MSIYSEIKNNEIVMDENNYKEIARRLLKDVNYKKGPVKIVKIARRAGFTIYEQDLEDVMLGYVVMGNEKINSRLGEKAIVIDEDLSHETSRRVIAHLVGVGLVCSNEKETYYGCVKNGLNNPYPFMIDFVQELMLPKIAFKTAIRDLESVYSLDAYKIANREECVDRLSEYFNIPRIVVENRLLRLIKKEECNHLEEIF